MKETIYYHLPGLFEFYDFYRKFLYLYKNHRDYFYDWCEIGSIYGSPLDTIWSGGRVECGETEIDDVLKLMQEYNISSRLTFSNSLIELFHLKDVRCNEVCEKFNNSNVKNGVIIYSDLLLDYIKKNYQNLYFVSSTTKVITDFSDFVNEINRIDFSYVVIDFRLNKQLDKLSKLSQEQKDKVEFLCNECCNISCTERKKCYESVSHKNLGDDYPEFICKSLNNDSGYKFSLAKKNPSFISIEDIKNIYLPLGFTNFKIEGRSLGSALLLEFILYYMAKPEYELEIREELYLDNMLDLF